MLWGHETNNIHNFIENAGWDGFDWDAGASLNMNFQNVVVGWLRWAGFSEEGAHDNQIVQNLAVMAGFPNVSDMYTMGWADNGNTGGPTFTADNYYIGNAIFKPSNYTKQPEDTKGHGGSYFAKGDEDATGEYDRIKIFFWGNTAFGVNAQGGFDHAQWLDTIPPEGQAIVDALANAWL